MEDTDVQIKFDAPAVLRKWPSRNYERISNSWPYLLPRAALTNAFGTSCPSQHLRSSV